MAARAALQYETEGFDTSGPRLMGRHAAGEALLKAWVRYAGADPLTFYSASRRTGAAFKAQVEGFGWKGPIARAGPDSLGALTAAGAMLLAGPGIGEQAWLRRRVDTRAWSVVGLTHTTASMRAMDSIAELHRAPVEPWDALICTSASVRGTVEQVLAVERDDLAHRLGARRFPMPQLPVIPLGVHGEDFAPQDGARAKWRAELGIGEGEPAVLHLGRLSFHAKAHPAPMCMAIGKAAEKTRVRAHLILAGWFANAGQEKVFRDAAAAYAPNVTLHVLDGRRAEVRREIWAAADAFCLFSDNIQETFGLAPVEAMAAGLPVVVSDWDGFRDTVGDAHGFRVRTLLAPPGSGDALGARHEAGIDDYDHYIGAASLSAAVDVGAATEAFAALFAYPSLRKKMGQAGQAHVAANLDWRVIIPRYLELFADLAARREAARADEAYKLVRTPQAGRLDPFVAFASYPTARLTGEMVLKLTARGAQIDAAALSALHRDTSSAALLTPPAELFAVLERCREGASAAQLADGAAPGERATLARSLVWLCKMDMLAWQEETR